MGRLTHLPDCEETVVQLIKELIEGGFVGQAIIASLLVAGYVWQAVHNQPIDPGFAGMVGLVVGWFFRSQAQVVADRRQGRANAKIIRAAMVSPGERPKQH